MGDFVHFVVLARIIIDFRGALALSPPMLRHFRVLWKSSRSVSSGMKPICLFICFINFSAALQYAVLLFMSYFEFVSFVVVFWG